MTVDELVDKLKEFDPALPVVMSDTGQWQYPSPELRVDDSIAFHDGTVLKKAVVL